MSNWSDELLQVCREARRWATAAQVPCVRDVDVLLAAVDREGKLLETILAVSPVDRHRFIELIRARRPAPHLSAKWGTPLDGRLKVVLNDIRHGFGGCAELHPAIEAILAKPSTELKELLESATARRALVKAEWLEAQDFWFPQTTALPGPGGERVDDAPYGNDRLATLRDLRPYLTAPEDEEHLPLFGVTIVVEDEHRNT